MKYERPSNQYVLAVAPCIPDRESSLSEIVSSTTGSTPDVSTQVGQLLADTLFKEYPGATSSLHQHALYTGIPGIFKHVISISEIEQILSCLAYDTTRVQLAQEGEYVDSSLLCDQSTSDGQPRSKKYDARRIELLLKRGATLIINGIDELHAQIGMIVNDVESITGTRVRANLYASWGTSAGFNTHWDDHDVVILQLNGQKEWRLYGPTTEYPVRSEKRVSLPPTEPISNIILTDADFLYIPRGHWHSVHPQSQLTIHLTLGIYWSNGLDLLHSLDGQLGSSPLIRSDIPTPQFTPGQIGDYIDDVIRAISTTINGEAISSYLGTQRNSLRPRHFVNLHQLPYLTSRSLYNDTKLRLVPSSRQISVSNSGHIVIINDGSKRVVLAQAGLPVIELLIRVRSCTFEFIVSELSSLLPSNAVANVLCELCEVSLVSMY